MYNMKLNQYVLALISLSYMVAEVSLDYPSYSLDTKELCVPLPGFDAKAIEKITEGLSRKGIGWYMWPKTLTRPYCIHFDGIPTEHVAELVNNQELRVTGRH